MSSYWADRFLSEEERRDKDNRRYYSTIEKEYNKALAGLEKDIEYWLGRIAKNNDISLSGAKELLSKKELQEFKWTVEEYIQRGKENEVSGQWLKQLENASARVHIQRLEALKIQIQDRIENMYTTRDRSMEDYLCRVYKDTYYHTVFEIDKGVESIQSSFNKLDDRKVLQIIHKPWAVDGKDFSTRIWEDKANLVNTLHTGLTQAFIRGGNLDDVVNDISQFVSSKIKNKKYVASRLVTTESAAYASKAQEQAYKDLSVDKYEILATLDLHTSDICQDLDGKIFDRKDYQVGVTAPPFHPNCRTVTVPWFPDDVDTGERAARGKDGKVGYVPQNMTYKEWYNKYVEQKFEESGIIKVENKKIEATMDLEDYQFYMELINNSNNGMRELYQRYSNDISGIKRKAKGGVYIPSSNTLEYSYPKEEDIKSGVSKYSTLAHEYGHYFDKREFFNNLNYREIEKLNNHFNLKIKLFEDVPSSSDEFLEALAKDKDNFIKIKLTKEVKGDLLSSSASGGVQDALDGMFGTFDTHILPWGHGDSYYDWLYNKKVKFLKLERELKKAYTNLGFTAKNQAQVKELCRRYETASEAWANICSAVTCGGKELEYTQKYLPNMYEAFLKIIKNIKKGDMK